MTLSCSCDDWCPDPGDWIYTNVSDYMPAPRNGYRKRCYNCKKPIEKGALCVRYRRAKIVEHDVEIAIYGEWEGGGSGEMPRASHWLCERCADICFSLEELGFCFPLDEIDEALEEYRRDYARE